MAWNSAYRTAAPTILRGQKVETLTETAVQGMVQVAALSATGRKDLFVILTAIQSSWAGEATVELRS